MAGPSLTCLLVTRGAVPQHSAETMTLEITSLVLLSVRYDQASNEDWLLYQTSQLYLAIDFHLTGSRQQFRTRVGLDKGLSCAETAQWRVVPAGRGEKDDGWS